MKESLSQTNNIMSRLKELRKEKGYTQVKMQMLTGIDQRNNLKLKPERKPFGFLH